MEAGDVPRAKGSFSDMKENCTGIKKASIIKKTPNKS